MARKRRKIKAGVGVALVAGVLAVAPATEAWNSFGTGCRFDPKNDNDGLGIGYDGSVPTSYRNATWSGASRWNQVMTPQFTIVPVDSSTRDVHVKGANDGANGTLAFVSVSCGSDHYTRDPVFQWNSAYAAHFATSVHELGHTYGLNHNNTESCDGNVAGLMHYAPIYKYNNCGFDGPTADDKTGAASVHNGVYY